jgi:hypothetical protein
MLLTPGVCNSQAGTAALEYEPRYLGRRHPDAVSTIRELRLRETGTVRRAAAVNAGRPHERYGDQPLKTP